MNAATFRKRWGVPLALILLGLVPVLAGTSRILELARGGPITPENARFFAEPLPVIVHITTATFYAFVGAFQFSPWWRRRRPTWHRTAGKLLVVAGLAVVLTGLWMQVAYELPANDGAALGTMRFVVGLAMLGALLLAIVALYRRDFVNHGAWMIRSYAIAMGAGTQVLTHVPVVLLVGPPDEGLRATLMGAGWGINVAFAEWIIRRRRPFPRSPSAAVPREGLPQASSRLISSS